MGQMSPKPPQRLQTASFFPLSLSLIPPSLLSGLQHASSGELHSETGPSFPPTARIPVKDRCHCSLNSSFSQPGGHRLETCPPLFWSHVPLNLTKCLTLHPVGSFLLKRMLLQAEARGSCFRP